MTCLPKLLVALLFTASSLLSWTAYAQDWGSWDTEESEESEAQVASAEEATEASPAPSAPPAPQVRLPAPAEDRRRRLNEIRESTNRQLQGGQGAIHIYQLVEEMIDEVIVDMSLLNAKVTSPMAMRSTTLSPNLSVQFGAFVESTLVSAVSNSTGLVVKRCVACQALRSRVEESDWVVSLGLTRQSDLRREAERLDVISFLDIKFSYFPGANIVAMQVELIRAYDGAILWTETYRSDATTAAILRTGDRVISRAERAKELERKLDARPYYGHILYLGGGYIPHDSPLGDINGMSIGYRLYEKFGEDRRLLFGIGAEGFANFGVNALLGSFVTGTFQWELFEANLNDPIVRTGPTIGGFFAGTEGNSFVFEWGLDVIMQFRLGAGVSAFYFVPTTYAGFDLGGFGGKGRLSFNW